MTITANKGEWAELYTLVQILLDNKVSVLDKNARPIRDKFYQFVELVRQDSGTRITFVPYDAPRDPELASPLPPREILGRLNQQFLREITSANDPSFTSPAGLEILRLLGIRSLKAASTEKIDLTAKLAGLIGADEPELGFSIKAQLGSPSTLFNAGSNTIFHYRVVGGLVDPARINSINSNSKYVDRVREIYNSGAELVFDHISSEVFPLNLDLIETSLQQKLAQLIVDSYRYDSKKVIDVIAKNTSSADDTHLRARVTYQVKNFLRAVALGMVPKKLWDGNLSAYGGYLIVDPNGNVGCLPLQNDDAFKDYLIENTKFDTPAQKSGEFGLLKRDSNNMLTFSLSLQIKFLK